MSRYHLKNDNADLASLTEQIKRLNEEKDRQAKEAQTVTQNSGPVTTTALRQSKTSLGTMLALGAAALVLLTVAALMLGHFMPGLFAGGGASREVPAVIGKKEADAKMTIAREGLRPVVKYVSNSKAPAGSIISVEPKPGARVKPGSDVVLRVASKPHKAMKNPDTPPHRETAPTPAGRETAETPRTPPRDTPRGDTPRATGETPRPTPPSQQQPATHHTVNPGQTSAQHTTPPTPAVTAKVVVPDVEGMVDTKASQVLAKAGLKAVITQGQDRDEPDRIVLKSDPKPGMALEAGALVNIVVNKVPAPTAATPAETRIALKNYLGSNGQVAYNDLRAQGFAVSYEYQATTLQAAGNVIRTLPPAGTLLASRSEVKLIIAK